MSTTEGLFFKTNPTLGSFLTKGQDIAASLPCLPRDRAQLWLKVTEKGNKAGQRRKLQI